MNFKKFMEDYATGNTNTATMSITHGIDPNTQAWQTAALRIAGDNSLFRGEKGGSISYYDLLHMNQQTQKTASAGEITVPISMELLRKLGVDDPQSTQAAKAVRDDFMHDPKISPMVANNQIDAGHVHVTYTGQKDAQGRFLYHIEIPLIKPLNTVRIPTQRTRFGPE